MTAVSQTSKGFYHVNQPTTSDHTKLASTGKIVI